MSTTGVSFTYISLLLGLSRCLNTQRCLPQNQTRSHPQRVRGLPRHLKHRRRVQLPSSSAPKKCSSHHKPKPSEDLLLIPKPQSCSPVVDTHSHVAHTFETYREKYKAGKYTNVYDFVQAMYQTISRLSS